MQGSHCALCSCWRFTRHGLTAVLPIYLVLLLNGSMRAFSGPAGQAFLPMLVPEQDFPNAVAWNSSVFQASAIAGPIVGGLLYGLTASPALVYTCAALEYLAALMLLAGIRVRTVEVHAPPPPFEWPWRA